MNRIYTIFLILFFAFCFSAEITAQAVSQSSLIKNVATLPTTCTAGDKNQKFVSTPDGKIYKCVSGAYAEVAGGTGGGSSPEVIVTSRSEIDTAITGNPSKIIKLTQNVTVSSPLIIPSNVLIESVNGAKFVKGVGGTIAIDGIGLAEPLSEEPIFSGFTPKTLTMNEAPVQDIKWTGSVYPSKISTGIFDNSTASARINMADQAFYGKTVEIHATVGTIAERVLVHEGHILVFAAGVFPNQFISPPDQSENFWLYSNTWVKGAGIGMTTIKQSSDTTSVWSSQLFYAVNVPNRGSNTVALHTNENIGISDMTIEGNGIATTDAALTQNSSSVLLGNVHNGWIQRIHFKRVNGFSAYFGTNSYTNPSAGVTIPNPNAYAKNAWITDCLFEDGGTQTAGSINSDGLIIERNIFLDTGYYAPATKQYANFIDLEPNTNEGRLTNTKIAENIFMANTENGARREQLNAIFCQSLGGMKGLQITNNQIIGTMLPYGKAGTSAQPIEQLFNLGIHVIQASDVLIQGNRIVGTTQMGVSVWNSSQVYVVSNSFSAVGERASPIESGELPVIMLSGVYDSVVRDNNIGKRNDWDDGFGNNAGFTNNLTPDSNSIVERDWVQKVNVSTTNGVTTLSYPRGDQGYGLYSHYINRTIYLTGTGVTTGLYTVNAVNEQAQTATLTTVAGNGTSVVMRTKYSNNHYINNFGAKYAFTTDSKSLVTDNSNGQPIYFFNIFISGTLDGAAYTIADLNIGKKTYFNIVSIEANSRITPGTCTTPPVIEVLGQSGDYYQNIPQTLDLTITGVNNSVQGNMFATLSALPVELKLITPASGCTGQIPKDYNVSVGYQTGVNVIRYTSVP